MSDPRPRVVLVDGVPMSAVSVKLPSSPVIVVVGACVTVHTSTRHEP